MSGYRQAAHLALAASRLGRLPANSGRDEGHAQEFSGSANCFETLQTPVARGRWTTSQDETAPVAVLSQAGWRKRFGSDPDAIGRTIRINGNAYTIVGIAPAGFEATFAPFAPEFWIPWNGPGLGAPRDDNRAGHM